MEQTEILNRCDHTLLRQDATWERFASSVTSGVQYGCASVCIPPSFVAQAAQYLAGCIAGLHGYRLSKRLLYHSGQVL